jgi:hypothetical protein
LIGISGILPPAIVHLRKSGFIQSALLFRRTSNFHQIRY